MAGMYGTTECEKISNALGGTISTAAELISLFKDGGLLGKIKALGLLLAISDDLIAVSSLNLTQFVSEIRDLDEADQKKITDTFNNRVALPSKDTEKMIEAIYASVVKGTDFVAELLNQFSPPVVPA